MSNLVPSNFKEKMDYCEILAKSSLVPSSFRGKKEDIFTAIEFGLMIGLNPMQALTNISVINGRPSVWGDAALALVKASGKEEYTKEYFEGDENNPVAVCETKRKDSPIVVIRKFSLKDAEKAGLLGKDTWKKYLKRMLQMRARAWTLRDAYPDVLSGIQIAEEMQDAEVVETEKSEINSNTIEAPKKEEPLYKVVGNLLMDRFKDSKKIKEFVKDVLEFDESVELKGKYLSNLTNEELMVLKTTLENENQLTLKAD